jgi:hypothetical protein
MSLATYANPGAAPLAFNPVYVDSGAGSDANNGLTPTTPKQTLAAASALLADGSHLILKRGSTWYEGVNLTALSNVTLAAYGTGEAPIIDGSAEIPETWTQPDAGTYPNLWQVSHTHVLNNNQSQLPVMKNGVQLVKKASDADVNSTAGSYSSVSDELLASNNPAIIKIYSTVDPNSDGNVYSVPVRMDVLTNAYGATSGLTVSGIQTQSQGSNDGSAIFGDDSTVKQSIFRNGHKHNALIESGSMTDFAVIDATDAGGIGVVLYSPDGAGKSGTFRRGMFMGRIGQTAAINCNGLYAHTSGTQHDSLTVEQCYFKGYGGALTGIASLGTFDGCYIHNCPLFSVNTPTTVIRYMSGRVDEYGGNAAAFETVGTHSISNSAVYSSVSGQEHIRLSEAHTGVTFTNNSFFDEIGGSRIIIGGVSTAPITFDHCVFWGSQQLPIAFNNSPPMTADFNVYYKAENFGSTNVAMDYGGSNRASLALWQAATGADANSVYCRPVDQVAGGANAFWLAWAEAPALTDLETVGPAVGDFRINPNARVYSGAEVAYIGTFADGTTLITTAGQQMHWDWNARQAVAGSNEVWPIVPETLADAQTYIAAPRDWEFYP